MTNALTRRHLLTAALAAGAAVPLAGLGTGRALAARPRLTLPRPTGPYRIGTVSLRLTGPGHPAPGLMTSVWYPATAAAGRYPVALWLEPEPTRALLAGNNFDGDAALTPFTAARVGAPALRSLGRLPVVVFSHGGDGHRSETTIIVQELASHGFVVVTVDHADAYGQFPDGTLYAPTEDQSVTPWDHANDIPLVLDRIEDLALPGGLGAIVDPKRIGMFGYSKGGTATALVAGRDPRIRAGLSLDGPMQCQPPISNADNRPFLMVTGDFTRAGDSSAADFWELLHGWRRNIQVDGAFETSYSDAQWLLPQLARITGLSDADLAKWIGPLDPARAVKIQQAYPLAFFDQHLRGRHQSLLDGPSRAFPEVCFIP